MHSLYSLLINGLFLTTDSFQQVYISIPFSDGEIRTTKTQPWQMDKSNHWLVAWEVFTLCYLSTHLPIYLPSSVSLSLYAIASSDVCTCTYIRRYTLKLCDILSYLLSYLYMSAVRVFVCVCPRYLDPCHHTPTARCLGPPHLVAAQRVARLVYKEIHGLQGTGAGCWSKRSRVMITNTWWLYNRLVNYSQ